MCPDLPTRLLRFLSVLALAAAITGCEALKKKKADAEGEAGAEGAAEESTADPAPDEPAAGVEPAPLESDFRKACAAQAAGAENGAVKGQDDWFFSGPELATLSKGGDFGSPAYESAVDAIVEYHRQLKQRGIQLVVVAAPPKAILYPDQLWDGWKLSRRRVQRFDSYLQALYAELRSRGVAVVDPTAEMLDERNAKTGRMYPQTDSRWSPRACELAARQAAESLRSGGWLTDDLKEPGIASQESNLNLQGDLAGTGGAAETVPARVVTRDGGLLAPSASAPLLVLGGTPAGAFRESGAGLADQLAAELRVPFDLIATDGPGRNVPRSRLLRKEVLSPGYLSGKKAVVWALSGTEFFQRDWLQVPASLKLQQGEEELRTADDLRRGDGAPTAPEGNDPLPIINPDPSSESGLPDFPDSPAPGDADLPE